MTTQTITVAKQTEAAGASPEFGDAYIALKAAAAQQSAVNTCDVEAILGRPATPFAQWVDDRGDVFNTN